jgi:inosose dehydratase
MPLTIGTNPDAFGIWSPRDQQRFPASDWLDAVAATGYHEVELGPLGYLGPHGRYIRNELRRRNLSLTAGYLSRLTADPADHAGALARLRHTARLTANAGGRFILAIASFYRDAADTPTGPRRFSTDDWHRFTRLLEDVARIASNEFGLQTVFHPHVDTAVEMPEDIERLMSSTSDRIGLCLDTGQVAYRGSDPAGLLRQWGSRVRYVHLRDLDPDATTLARVADLPFETAVRCGLFCDPGTGLVDFLDFRRAVRETGFSGPAIVERSLLGASPAQAAATADRARRYYESIGLTA